MDGMGHPGSPVAKGSRYVDLHDLGHDSSRFSWILGTGVYHVSVIDPDRTVYMLRPC
jgi:hypothetical protein